MKTKAFWSMIQLRVKGGNDEITILNAGVIKTVIKDYDVKTNPVILQNNSVNTQKEKSFIIVLIPNCKIFVFFNAGTGEIWTNR